VLVGSLPLIALNFGFYSKEKLNVSLIAAQVATAHAQLLASGQVDFAIAVDPPAIQRLRAQGATVALASGSLYRQAAALVCQKSLSMSGTYPQIVKALEGHTVGVTAPGTPADQVTRYTLADAGVDLNKVTVINTGNQSLITSSLQAGKIDCGYLTQPAPVQVGADFKVMVDYASTQSPKALQNFIFVPLAAGPSVIGNRAVLRAFARAMKAAAKFAGDPKNASQLAQKLLDTFPGLTLSVLTRVFEESASAWSASLTDAMFKNTNTINQKVTGQASDFKLTDFVSKDVIDIVAGS
jgi:ABC-type nitrate/sulfonate/bicarbonate transport system substrate-binding protein